MTEFCTCVQCVAVSAAAVVYVGHVIRVHADHMWIAQRSLYLREREIALKEREAKLTDEQYETGDDDEF
jgi:hypothetical protein